MHLRIKIPKNQESSLIQILTSDLFIPSPPPHADILLLLHPTIILHPLSLLKPILYHRLLIHHLRIFVDVRRILLIDRLFYELTDYLFGF